MINRALVGFIALIGALVAAFLSGVHYSNTVWVSKTAKQSVQVAKVQQKQTDIASQVVTKYVDRVRVIHEQGATITKEVKVYVPQSVDCTVPIGFVRLLNSAASGKLLTSSKGTNAASNGIERNSDSK